MIYNCGTLRRECHGADTNKSLIELTYQRARKLASVSLTAVRKDANALPHIQHIIPELFIGEGHWEGCDETAEVWVHWRYFLNTKTHAFSIADITTNAILVDSFGIPLDDSATVEFCLRRIRRLKEWRQAALMGRRAKQPVLNQASEVPVLNSKEISWKEHFLSKVAKCADDPEIIKLVQAVVIELGFHNLSTSRRDAADSKIVVREINLSTGWQETYLDYITIDPRVRHHYESPGSLIWTSKVTPQSLPTDVKFWDIARPYGVVSGWSQASADKLFLFFVSRTDYGVTRELIDKVQPHLMVLFSVMDDVLKRKMEKSERDRMRAKLTEDDIQLLILARQGNSMKQIAKIIDDSVSATESRWKRVREKLNATNKEQAIATGLLIGALDQDFEFDAELPSLTDENSTLNEEV